MMNFLGKDIKSLNLFLDRQINIKSFGDFNIGLSNEEINTYLQQRYNSYAECLGMSQITKRELKSLRKKFAKITGINTQAVIYVNGKSIELMYRYDVKRFADVLFIGKTTVWD